MKYIAIVILAVSGWGFSESPDVPRLTVRGQATLKKPADELVLTVGVLTEAEEASAALQENSQKMQKVIGTLKKLGLEEMEYETGRFQISPKYAPRPLKNAEEWRPTIEGYQVTNALVITTGKIKSAGVLIDTLTQAGANTISDIRFGLKDPEMYRKEAIDAATKNAMKDAKTLATAAHQNLKRILFLSLDQATLQQPAMRAAPLMMRAFESTPIEAGEVEVTASVNLIYEVEATSLR